MSKIDEYHSVEKETFNKSEAELHFFSIWNKHLQDKLAAVRKSYRWRIGHTVIRIIEMILGRWKPKLALDDVEEMLRFQEQYLDKRLSVRHRPEPRYRSVSQASEILKTRLDSGQLILGFAVSEAHENTRTGDFFTAQQLGQSCQKNFGYQVQFLEHEKDWYDLEGIDILICLLDNYKIDQIKNAHPHLIKICWSRNWFDRWIAEPSFKEYDMHFCSSKLGCLYFELVGGVKSDLLPIATDFERFSTGQYKKQYASDYCFTGNKWRAPREIEEWLKPGTMPYNFAIFGQGWEKSKNFKPFLRGHVSYANMPDVYASTKLVIDDANFVTKPFGSINSRVFDALAAGVLVITNGEKGVSDLFNHAIPVYHNQKELHELIHYYLSNDYERIQLAQKLQNEIARFHTYDQRAHALNNVLKDFVNQT